MAERRIFTLSEIVDTITTKIGNTSRNLTDFSDGSNIRSIVDAFSHFVEFLQLQINIGFDSFSYNTAKGKYLENRALDFNIEKKKAVNSYGTINFNRSTPAPEDFTIEAGSQVSTDPDVFGNTIDYVLISDTTFPSGALSVSGLVICSTAGSIGNQPSGVITNITSNIPGVDTVTNPSAFTAGADAETDEQLRKRIADHINGLKAGNEAAIRAAALAIPGIMVARIDENVPRRGEFTLYISNQSGILTQEQIDAVKKAVEDMAAFCITANIAEPTVSYVDITMDIVYDTANYVEEEVTARIKNAVYETVTKNPDTELKIVDIILSIMPLNGVTNVKNVKINGVAADFKTETFGVIRLATKNNNITINYVS